MPFIPVSNSVIPGGATAGWEGTYVCQPCVIMAAFWPRCCRHCVIMDLRHTALQLCPYFNNGHGNVVPFCEKAAGWNSWPPTVSA